MVTPVAIAAASMRHELTARPFTSTVQALHSLRRNSFVP
jgi:hypothetical protein